MSINYCVSVFDQMCESFESPKQGKPNNCSACGRNIVYHTMDSIKKSKSYDSLIPYVYPSMITQSIYMGSIMSAMDKDNLKKIGITHIINCIGKEESEKFPNYESIDGIEYMYINMGSSNQADLSQYPESTCVFIENALKVNGKILIHCKRGMNRSGSIVIAYIMNKFRMPFDDAYKFVQSKRS